MSDNDDVDVSSYYRREYEVSDAAVFWQDLPRNDDRSDDVTHDITALFSGDRSTIEAYTTSLVLPGFLCGCLFVLWILFVLLFWFIRICCSSYCCCCLRDGDDDDGCTRKVGFLSGRNFHRPPRRLTESIHERKQRIQNETEQDEINQMHRMAQEALFDQNRKGDDGNNNGIIVVDEVPTSPSDHHHRYNNSEEQPRDAPYNPSYNNNNNNNNTDSPSVNTATMLQASPTTDDGYMHTSRSMMPPTQSRRGNYDDDDDEAGFENISCGNRPTRIRCIFIFCGILFLAYSLLFVMRGLDNLQSTVNTVHTNAVAVNDITSDAISLIDNELVVIQDEALNVRDELLVQLERDVLCPGDPNIEESTIVQDLLDLASDTIDILEGLDDFIIDDIIQFKDVAVSSQDMLNQVITIANDLDITGPQAAIVVTIYALVTALLIVGSIFAMFDIRIKPYACILNTIIFPLFLLLVLASCITCCLASLVVGMHSDFCYPESNSIELSSPTMITQQLLDARTPDVVVLAVLEKEGYLSSQQLNDDDQQQQQQEDTNNNNLLGTGEYTINTGDVVYYYVNQCSNDIPDPFQSLRNLIPEIQTAEDLVLDLDSALDDPENVAALELYCGENFDAQRELLDNVVSVLDALTISIEKIEDLIDCRTIVPIYTSMIYDGVCDTSINASFWIFICSFIMSISGLLMITFRASYKKTLFYNPYNNNDYDLALTTPTTAAGIDSRSGSGPDHHVVTVADYGLEPSSPMNNNNSTILQDTSGHNNNNNSQYGGSRGAGSAKTEKHRNGGGGGQKGRGGSRRSNHNRRKDTDYDNDDDDGIPPVLETVRMH